MEESTISESSENNNPTDTSNNYISTALNNLSQALYTTHSGKKYTGATSNHAPVLDTFASDPTFDLSSRSGSTAFQISCAPLDVT